MATFFGTQSFTTSDQKKDKKVVYEFTSKKDLDMWMNSDMTPYVPGGVDKKFSRQKLSAKEAEKELKAGAKKKNFENKAPAIEGSHAHIRHTDPKFKDNFGLVVRFENDKQRSEFMKRNGDYYDKNITHLKNTDKRVIAANINGAALNYSNDKKFDSQVKMALKQYPQLDPSKNHLAMISQKGVKGEDGKIVGRFSKPEVYSFSTKSYRDYFVAQTKKSSKLPITAGKLENFHPIAVNHATNGLILNGSLNDHYQHRNQYLSLNNANDKSLASVSAKEMISQKDFEEKLAAGEKNFTSKDLRGIDFSNSNLKGMDFSNSTFAGQNLDGMNFSQVKAIGADFSKTTLNGTKFDGAKLSETNFRNSKTNSAAVSFKGADLSRADMKYSDVPKADLRDAKLVRTNLYKSNLKNSATVGANLNGAEFNGVNLEGSQMDSNLGAYKGASFTGANLKGTAIESSPLNTPVKDQGSAKAM